MTETLFWVSVGVVAYTYLIFPLLILARGTIWHAAVKADFESTPRVDIIVAAHNEAAGIAGKLDNLLSLDYPREQMQITVASDGSTDATCDIVREFAERGVRLLDLPRRGKAAALNDAVADANADVLVFSDANSMFAPNALRHLVAPFADPAVGGVAGDQRYRTPENSAITAQGERSYWNFDRVLKVFQSRAGNVISATGAVYAIRRSLFVPVPDGVTDDFVTSTRVIEQGRRLIFQPSAAAYEPVATEGSAEFGRKVRVMTRGLRGVIVMRRLLNPVRFGFYSLQLLSHKVLRRLVVFPLIILLVTNCLLWSSGPIYRLAMMPQAAIYAMAVMGLLFHTTGIATIRLLTLPFYFCMVNAAALVASVKLLLGHRVVVWEPQRVATPGQSLKAATSQPGD